MDERTWQQKLAETLNKEPAALTPGDIEFIRARRDYLNEAQLQTYAEILGLEEKVEKPSKKKSE